MKRIGKKKMPENGERQFDEESFEPKFWVVRRWIYAEAIETFQLFVPKSEQAGIMQAEYGDDWEVALETMRSIKIR